MPSTVRKNSSFTTCGLANSNVVAVRVEALPVSSSNTRHQLESSFLPGRPPSDARRCTPTSAIWSVSAVAWAVAKNTAAPYTMMGRDGLENRSAYSVIFMRLLPGNTPLSSRL